jgi:hypothetical protein
MNNPRPDRLLTNCTCCFCNVRRRLGRRTAYGILTFEQLHATGHFPQKTWRALSKVHADFNKRKISANNASVLICKALLKGE